MKCDTIQSEYVETRCDMERMNGKKLAHYIECNNPKCRQLFSTQKKEKAVYGFLNFCSEECKRVYREMLDRNSREQK